MKKRWMILTIILLILSSFSVSSIILDDLYPVCPNFEGMCLTTCEGLDEEVCEDSYRYLESCIQCSWTGQECVSGGSCDCTEICDDGLDNDCDQLVDCEDPDCEENPDCVVLDFGDAPDSTNNWNNAQMTAYPIYGPAGVVANFPSVWVAGSPPFGPCHYNYFARLGTEISGETDADMGPDQDTTNNILPATDVPDQDSISLPFQMDDGLKHVPIDPTHSTLYLYHCQQNVIPVEVTIQQPPEWTYYLNIWIDYNRDGDWGTPSAADTVSCPTHGVSEWVVQNFAVSGSGIVYPSFNGYVPQGDNKDAWIRVQLSEVQVTIPDGSASGGCFEDGETEDYYVEILSEGDNGCEGPDCPAVAPEFTTIGLVIVILTAVAVFLYMKHN